MRVSRECFSPKPRTRVNIRAEVIGYEDYIKLKGEQGAKEAGRMRLEGKEYVVQDGDVMHFRFNV